MICLVGAILIMMSEVRIPLLFGATFRTTEKVGKQFSVNKNAFNAIEYAYTLYASQKLR